MPRLASPRHFADASRQAQYAALTDWGSPADQALLKSGRIDPSNIVKPSGGPAFTRNRVSIEVSGAEVPVDIAFIDLPGLTANGGQEFADPELIREIVLEVITKPTCLILSCLTMAGASVVCLQHVNCG